MKKILTGIDLEVKPGELVVVSGPVGVGKSTLLEGLLFEVPLIGGSLGMAPCCRVAMSPQEPWIMAGTLRENIIFESPFDAERLEAVLDACALRPDVEQLPGGLNTEIGEKGVNLSGGQKARVSLARACYCKADLVLLDDPLSAVDPAVSQHLFESCIKRWLTEENGCAVVLVTHQRQFLHSANKIVLLQGNDSTGVGTIKDQGSFDELLSRGLVENMAASIELADIDGEELDFANIGGDGSTTVSTAPKMSKSGEVKLNKSSGPSLTVLEDRETGVVSKETWIAYLTASGTWLAIFVIFLFACGQVSLLLADWWLFVWAKAPNQESPQLLGIFIFLCVSTVVVSFLRSIIFFFTTLKASSELHNLAARRLFASPLSFFAATPAGRIVNRFSADLGQVDEQLATCLFDTLQISCLTGAGLCVACVVFPPIALLVPAIFSTMYYLRGYTTVSMRELKRLDGTSRSPVYSAFRAALQGLVCIRAYGRQAQSQRAFVSRLNKNAKTWFWWLIVNRWFGFWLDIMCFIVLSCTAFVAVAMRSSVPPGLIGLALVYVLGLSGMFQYMMRQSTLVETYMTSVERLNHYAHRLPAEEFSMDQALRDGNDRAARALGAAGSSEVATSGRLMKDVGPSWPSRGGIVLKDLRVRYRRDLPEVIKGISVAIEPGSKVGVCGRTGSGKSSLLLAFSRLNEICGGGVVLDGIDTAHVTLPRLRKAIAVIPQEPHLFSGTIRFNLDPFQEYDDADVWAALESARLRSFVETAPGGLSTPVSEGGGNWSAGQRQLLSIARAILHRRRVVLLDEATASVDYEADQAIQAMLRSAEAFRGCTLIVIAHRIETIIDSDQVLVLDNGILAESGPPQELIAQGGVFSGMVATSRNTSKGHI